MENGEGDAKRSVDRGLTQGRPAMQRGERGSEQLSRRDLLGRIGVGAAAAGFLDAITPGRAAAQTTQKRELAVAQGGDVSKLDPHLSTSSNDIRVSFNLFDNLTSRHPDGKLFPGLAVEWGRVAPTTWQFAYGKTASYGGLAPGKPFPAGSGTTSVGASARIAYLSPGTTYHYKLIASKAGRALSTADATFTTPAH